MCSVVVLYRLHFFPQLTRLLLDYSNSISLIFLYPLLQSFFHPITSQPLSLTADLLITDHLITFPSLISLFRTSLALLYSHSPCLSPLFFSLSLPLPSLSPSISSIQGHDIRYKGLEFDGWSERHWTLPFLGER